MRLLLVSIALQGVLAAPADDLKTVAQLRRVDLAKSSLPASNVPDLAGYVSTQNDNGTWDDVDYTAGCDGLILDAITKGMDWWFDRDFTDLGCIDQGGLDNGTCPCGTPGLWNTNWYDQVIQTPTEVSTACLFVYDVLNATQQQKCVDIVRRIYDISHGFIYGIRYLTGTNTVNVMQNTVSLAAYTKNATMMADAFSRAFDAMKFSLEPSEDGIHPDGTYFQHNAVLYNGNYGSGLIAAFVQLQSEASQTNYTADDEAKTAFATLIQGSEWMTFWDAPHETLHWDIDTIGRFIAFPTATEGIANFDVEAIRNASLDFTGSNNLTDTLGRLETNASHDELVGNRMFWASDYMVHRRPTWKFANKMISTRTLDSEYVNLANPYGYYLGQGDLFTYETGAEYYDVYSAWDWQLIPGTTVIPGYRQLESSQLGVRGNKTFVGGASDGWVGTTAMDYTDPRGGLTYRKAWFFLDDSMIVTTEILENPSSSPAVTVLQNQNSLGPALVDGKEASGNVTGQTMWHDGDGYLAYGAPFKLDIFNGQVLGNWSDLSTSTAPPENISLFSATAEVSGKQSFAIYPNSTSDIVLQQAGNPSMRPLNLSDGVWGVAGQQRLSLVFWPDSNLKATVDLGDVGLGDGQLEITTDTPHILLMAWSGAKMVVTVAEPAQTAENLTLSIRSDRVRCGDDCEQQGDLAATTAQLPTGGYGGQSVFLEYQFA